MVIAISLMSSFGKLRFQNALSPRENEKPAISNFSGLKSIFENSEKKTISHFLTVLDVC